MPDASYQTAAKVYRIVDPTQLHGRTVPEREWVVRDWLPVGSVTINYGDGGIGKTLLAQMLMTSCATGTPWCGLSVMRCRTFGLFCEDDADELHRRQQRINLAADLHFSDLTDMRWTSGVGHDNLLMTFDRTGRSALTDRWHEIEREAAAFGAKLVVIDTAADCFGGNENDRAQVTQFIGNSLGKLALAIGGAVLLNAHPSRAGKSEHGDGDGGSTGWSNKARSRWFLARPKADGDGGEDRTERVLTNKKANYGPDGAVIRLRWVNGVLVPLETEGGAFAANNREMTKALFLLLLDRCAEQGLRLSNSPNAGNYAPKLFAKRPDREGCNRRDFETAMQQLFIDRKIRIKPYGRSGDSHRELVRDDTPTEGVDD